MNCVCHRHQSERVSTVLVCLAVLCLLVSGISCSKDETKVSVRSLQPPSFVPFPPAYPGFEGDYPAFPEHGEFHSDASVRDEGLLLKVIWYDAPYPDSYERLELREDGRASTHRYVPDAVSRSWRTAQLSQASLRAIKARIAALDAASQRRYPLKEESGARYTAVVWYKDRTYHRNDFVGALPEGISNLVAAIEGEIASEEDRRAREAYREAFPHGLGAEPRQARNGVGDK